MSGVWILLAADPACHPFTFAIALTDREHVTDSDEGLTLETSAFESLYGG